MIYWCISCLSACRVDIVDSFTDTRKKQNLNVLCNLLDHDHQNHLQTLEHVGISNMVRLFPCMVKNVHGTKILFILLVTVCKVMIVLVVYTGNVGSSLNVFVFCRYILTVNLEVSIFIVEDLYWKTCLQGTQDDYLYT